MLPLLILAAVAVAVVVRMLTFRDVKNWFTTNEILNKDHVNVVVKEKLANGHFKTVGGVFNKKTNKIAVATAWESEKLDSKLGEMPRVSVLRDEA